jgi:hypothetical protein
LQSEFFYDPYASNAKKKSTEKAYNKNVNAFTEQYSTKDQLGNSTPPYEYRPKQPNYATTRVSVNEPHQFHNQGQSVLDNMTNRGMDMTELVDRPHREPIVNQQAQPHPVLRQTHQMSSNYVSADENEPPPQWVELENAQLIPNTDTDDQNISDNERGQLSCSFFLSTNIFRSVGEKKSLR